MAKKTLNMNYLKEVAHESDLVSASNDQNNKTPKHIPRITAPKTPVQTTIKIYKEDLIDLKMIASKKYTENLSQGIDKRISTIDLMEEAIDFLKKKYNA